MGQNFATVTYARTTADISVDPEIGIEDAEMKLDTVMAAYVRTFKLFDKSARIEIRQGWQHGKWDGLVNGVPTSVERNGFGDTIARLAVNLAGGPPLSPQEFGKYRATHQVDTVVGAAVSVHLPTGEYFEDKLINLGNNRFLIRPQLGVQHRRRNWTFEATGMLWLYTDNDDFFNGNKLERDPFLTLDGTAIYTFKSGIWASASAGIGVGGETIINGVANGDDRRDFAWAVSAGMPLSRTMGVRVGYFRSNRWRFIGNDSRMLSIGLQASFR